MTATTHKVRTVLEMIKFEHSVFALPFALTATLLAARYDGNASPWPTAWQITWIVVAMVAARAAAMTMNRIADLRYDRLNPRTQSRPLQVKGRATPRPSFFPAPALRQAMHLAGRPQKSVLRLDARPPR